MALGLVNFTAQMIPSGTQILSFYLSSSAGQPWPQSSLSLLGCVTRRLAHTQSEGGGRTATRGAHSLISHLILNDLHLRFSEFCCKVTLAMPIFFQVAYRLRRALSLCFRMCIPVRACERVRVFSIARHFWLLLCVLIEKLDLGIWLQKLLNVFVP